LELIYEHRNYLPSMTLFLLAGIGIIAFLRYFNKNQLLKILSLVLVWITLAGQGHTVYLRNALFEHPLYMWLDNAKKSPGLSRVHNNLARTYDEMGMPEEARYAYLDAIKANRYPKRSSRGLAFLNLADNYLNAGDPAAALKLYQQAKSVDSGQWMVWHGVAAAMVHQEDLARAQSLLDFALKQDPDKAPLHSLYSLVLLKLGVVDHAIKEAKAALAYEPDSPLALKVLGEAYTRLEKYVLAHKYWKQYALSHTEDLEALLAILQLAHQLGDEKELRRAAVHILDIRQDRTWNECFEELKNRQGQDFLVHMADPRQALPLIRKAVEMEIHEIQ
jgi:tetratricopeptide (TPR) repeat protein